MKTIGVIGGMSWESTAVYYRLLNEQVNIKCGGFASAKIVLLSVNFAEIESLQRSGQWNEAAQRLALAAVDAENANADVLILATNTMHKVADAIAAAVSIPFLHITDALGDSLRAHQISRVALLGTTYTMTEDFYRGRLADKYGIQTIIPNSSACEIINRVIFEELCKGIIREESKREYLHIISRLADEGAQAVALACTEINLLIKEKDANLPLFDTAEIHCNAAVKFALEKT